MRLGCLGQRKFFADHRTQRPVFQSGHQRGVNTRHFCRRRVWQHHSAKINIALHRVARIDLHPAAAPDNRDTSALCENGQIFPEINVREQFHDHINAAPVGRVHDLLEMIGRVMIEHFVRALLPRELESFVTARATEHAQATSARQLHRCRPDPATRAVHQDYFARLGLGALEQPAIRRRVRGAHCRALRKGNVFR